jgi:hypothetical protein
MFNHENDKKFLFVMAALAEASGQECSDFKIKIYAQALADIPVEAIEQAAWSVINTRTFATFPKVAEIREHLSGGKSDDKAILALDKLEKAMSRHGKYRSVCFDDPVLMATVVSIGGWPKICSMEMDEWKWARKDFERLYKAFSAQPVKSLEIPSHLSGIAEISNSANRYEEDPEIVQIGHVPAPKQLEGGKNERRTSGIAHQLSEKLGIAKR